MSIEEGAHTKPQRHKGMNFKNPSETLRGLVASCENRSRRQFPRLTEIEGGSHKATKPQSHKGMNFKNPSETLRGLVASCENQSRRQFPRLTEIEGDSHKATKAQRNEF